MHRTLCRCLLFPLVGVSSTIRSVADVAAFAVASHPAANQAASRDDFLRNGQPLPDVLCADGVLVGPAAGKCCRQRTAVSAGQSFQPIWVRVTDSAVPANRVVGASVALHTAVFAPYANAPVETNDKSTSSQHSPRESYWAPHRPVRSRTQTV